MHSSRPPPTRGDVVVPLPAPRSQIAPASHFRSTLVLSSVLTLKARGLFERYSAKLAPERRAAIDGLVAGTWLPIDLAVAHYDACEALGLTPNEQFSIGTHVAEQVQGGLLGTIVRAATKVGVTPWLAIESYPRLWERLIVGGAVTIDRLGPKDALIEAVGLPMSDNRYFRNAFRGMNHAAFAPLCERLFVKDQPEYGFACRISWV